MRNLKAVGILGTIIAGVLCLTPILVIAFGAAGLSWLTPYNDYWLIPIMVLSMGVAGYAYYREQANK